MDQKIELTNETFMKLHEKVEKHEGQINGIKQKLVPLNQDVSDLKSTSQLSEATLRYVIREEMDESMKPFVDKATETESRVTTLENEKYKLAFDILKWVIITVVGVGVTAWASGIFK